MNEQCVEGGSMNKKRLALLEKAFAAEINAAIEKHPLHLIQSNSKLAETMANEAKAVPASKTTVQATAPE